MKNLVDALWAKKSDDFGNFKWLPLLEHLYDTMEISGLLWHNWLSQGQRELIIDSLDIKEEEVAYNLVRFLGAIHDIGKATPCFQVKSSFTMSKDIDEIILERLEKAGFDGINNLYLAFPNKSHHSIAGQKILRDHGVRDDISSIVGAHHGKPIDSMYELNSQEAYGSNYYQIEDSDNPIHIKWKQCQSYILNWALEKSSFYKVENLPKIKQPAQVVLSGLLIMADWIASNESYFPLINIFEEKIVDRESRIANGWLNWHKLDSLEGNYEYDTESIYIDRFNFKPNDIQKTFWETIDSIEEPGIIILEAPMGYGKTEGALIASEQLAYKNKANGMFFGLPTQATSNGIFPRILNWLNNMAEDAGEKAQTRLVHGKAALNPVFHDLAENIDIDGYGNVAVNQWFSGKKTSNLDDFVVGTVDQFLLTALKQKHLSLRHLGFSKKVVIIDEVHAYDSYMNQYLLEAIRWMAVYNVPVIILSATLPNERRREIIKAYLKGKGIRERQIDLDCKKLKDSYPVISYTDSDKIKQENNFKAIENKTIDIIKIQDQEICDYIDDLVTSEGIIGIVVNTVKRSQDLAKKLSEIYGEDMVELIHSNFIAIDRIEKEDNLLKSIGSGAKRPRRKIIIGTQVIEQSLDIDFDVMISDLAPMDLLLQRAGRMHRHDIDRPLNKEIPRLYILGTNENLDFEKGSSYIYGEYLLTRTQYFLEDKISLPGDISKLVQKVYGDEEIDLDKDLIEKYSHFKENYKNRIKRKEAKAKVFKIDKPELKYRKNKGDSIIGWLKDHTRIETEERAYAQVRDTEETIEVIALREYQGGYSIFGEKENLKDKISNPEIAKEIAKATLTLPKSLSRPSNIDKTIKELEEYNNENLRDWQEQSWLKGSLGIIFDENNEFKINGYRLIYSQNYGLEYERMK